MCIRDSFSIVSALLAWVLSVVINPGGGMVFSGQLDPSLQKQATGASGWKETLLNFVTTNIFSAMSTASMIPPRSRAWRRGSSGTRSPS